MSPGYSKNVRKPKQGNMYDFVWTGIFPLLKKKTKESLEIPCNQKFSNIHRLTK